MKIKLIGLVITCAVLATGCSAGNIGRNGQEFLKGIAKDFCKEEFNCTRYCPPEDGSSVGSRSCDLRSKRGLEY